MKNNFYIDLILLSNHEDKLLETPIRFSTFENGVSNSYGSFDESLSYEENEVKELNFSLYKYIDNKLNPFWKYIVQNRKVRLYSNEFEDYVDFYITSITPTTSKNNIKYTVKCQDAFSYELSKQNVSLYFSTDDESIWGITKGPKTIDELVKKVLFLAKINYVDSTNLERWHLSSKFINEFYDDTYLENSKAKISIETTSTPFGILVEICKLFNAIMSVNHKTKEINLSYKEHTDYKGHTLSPDYNLGGFTYAESSEDSYNIMHVQGGEDAYGNFVSIMPPLTDNIRNFLVSTGEWVNKTNLEMYDLFLKYGDLNDDDRIFWTALTNKIPHAGEFLYDFSNELKSGLINKVSYEELIKMLEIDLRNINLNYLCYAPTYYKGVFDIKNVEQQIENIAAAIAAEENATANNKNNNSNLNEIQEAMKIEYNGFKYVKIYEHMALEPIYTLTNCEYGVFNGVDYSYYLPELVNLNTEVPSKSEDGRFLVVTKDFNNEDYYYLTTGNGVEVDVNTNQFSMTYVPNSYHVMVYRKLYDNDSYDFKINNDLNIIGLSQHTISSYNSQMAGLCNASYIHNISEIYGRLYLSGKIASLKADLASDEQKLKNVENELMKLTGKDSITSALNVVIGSSVLDTIDKQLKYSDLVRERETLTIKVGGVGSNGMVFSGYYKTLLAHWERIYNENKDDINNYQNTPLEEKMRNYLSSKNNWWTTFYNKFYNIIRETKFEDSTQLTSNSLFTAAKKQFLTCGKVQQNYSLTQITTDDLVTNSDPIRIGDIVRVYTGDLFTSESNSTFIISIKERIADKSSVVLLPVLQSLDKLFAKIDDIQYDDMYTILTISLLKKAWNNTIVEDEKKEYIEDIVINTDDIYNYNRIIIGNSDYLIHSIVPQAIEKPVMLNITGIKKNLRESKSTLVVKEHAITDYIIDKLISSLR